MYAQAAVIKMIALFSEHPPSSSSLFSEWDCSPVWHIHLLSARAKLWQARWQKAVISPLRVWFRDRVCQKYLRKPSLLLGSSEWVMMGHFSRWAWTPRSVPRLRGETGRKVEWGLSEICQVDAPFECLLCRWDATKGDSWSASLCWNSCRPQKVLWAQLLSRGGSLLTAEKAGV